MGLLLIITCPVKYKVLNEMLENTHTLVDNVPGWKNVLKFNDEISE